MWHAKEKLRFDGTPYGPEEDAGTELPMIEGVDYRELERFERIEWRGEENAKQYAPEGVSEAPADPLGPLKQEPEFTDSQNGDEPNANGDFVAA